MSNTFHPLFLNLSVFLNQCGLSVLIVSLYSFSSLFLCPLFIGSHISTYLSDLIYLPTLTSTFQHILCTNFLSALHSFMLKKISCRLLGNSSNKKTSWINLALDEENKYDFTSEAKKIFGTVKVKK